MQAGNQQKGFFISSREIMFCVCCNIVIVIQPIGMFCVLYSKINSPTVNFLSYFFS